MLFAAIMGVVVGFGSYFITRRYFVKQAQKLAALGVLAYCEGQMVGRIETFRCFPSLSNTDEGKQLLAEWQELHAEYGRAADEIAKGK